jgi:hypothetical protein
LKRTAKLAGLRERERHRVYETEEAKKHRTQLHEDGTEARGVTMMQRRVRQVHHDVRRSIDSTHWRV